ncbi:MAG: hypothetical protein U0837_11490 [Dehalococcoidia bacterium]|jgi:hypothetical protein
MSTEALSELCVVCLLTVEPYMVAYCGVCGSLYHLNSRADLPGEDCGQVWINEDHLGLEFACNTCLNPEPPPGALDDVLDLAEAATVAKLPESVLERAAQLGHLKHRQTSSGVLLFTRGDVLAFAVAH